MKDTLQISILRTGINMRAKSFIKISVNVTEMRIDEGTQNMHLEEHCTKIETTFHLFYALLFLTNLVFKFNMVLIGFFFFFSFFFDNVIHSLLFCLLLTFISLILKFIQCLTLFIRNSKILMRLKMLQNAQTTQTMLLYFHEKKLT